MTLHLRRTLVATTIENAYPRPPARELTEAEQRALYFWLHHMLYEREVKGVTSEHTTTD